jgi:uncharacterized protein (TIGR02453 family)
MARTAPAKAMEAPPVGGFTGFDRATLTFFESLEDNNNRDWFTANRDIYDTKIHPQMCALIADLSFAFQAHEIAFTGDAKRSMFRINRDIRFSKDKSPYKTHISCVFSRDGSKQGVGILYLQIGGGDVAFMAQGFYDPEPDDLASFRRAIAAAPQRWQETEAALEAEGLPLSHDHALTRLPKGFEAHAGTPIADALRLKSFVVRRAIKTSRLYTASLVDDVVAFARAGAPLIAFGRRAIDEGRAR